jgi:hypothetical protein
MKLVRRTALAAVLIAACVAAALAAGIATHGTTAVAKGAGDCQLGGKNGQIKHVIYLQFDNTHYRRDNPNVPSDLEQMPNLLNFLKDNGTVLTKDHTILISHTAGGILSSLTGLYPDRDGMTVSNSYDYFQSSGTSSTGQPLIGLPKSTSGFKYWTNTVDGTNETLPNMVGDGGQTAPAPWLTYTHAGCNVGGVSAANIELENNSTAPGGDIFTVYGPNSPEAAESPTLRQADFVGIAIHCALGNALCSSNAHAKPDQATTIAGSDDGYQALLGAKYVNQTLNHSTTDNCVKTVDGTQNITDPSGNCGFPGFDGALAKNTLGEVAKMQENGVPVTFAYISDAHDNHSLARASGPGEEDYMQQLRDYNTAFGVFFDRLKRDGIDKSNTLFVVTVDEGDHFAGGVGTPDPSSTDGALTYSHTLCTDLTKCPSNQIGEVTVNLKNFVPGSYDIHFDDAPTFYVNGQPERTNPAVRTLEQTLGTTSLPDPYAAGGTAPLAVRLADTVEEKTLHMVNSDPKRTPTFTMFGTPDFFFQTSNGCKVQSTDVGFPECVDYHFAWNHGDIQDEIGNTWAGYVGPGVQNLGIDDSTWTDHVDLRPTINALLGVQDNYLDDGRVVTQILDQKSVPKGLDNHSNTTEELGAAYKAINAPFGDFALATLDWSTQAIESTDALKYDRIEAAIANLTVQRDALAGTIRQALNDASGGGSIDESQAKAWIAAANDLLARAKNPDTYS